MSYQNSDSDLTMMAENVFDDILSMIKNSKLNFQLKLSPFSAHISLKKSLQKDRIGRLQIPSFESDEVKQLKRNNKQLQSEIDTLNLIHDKSYNELKSTKKKLKELETYVQVRTEVDELTREIMKLKSENDTLKIQNQHQLLECSMNSHTELLQENDPYQ